ncbi:MAG: DNA-3-methyladenine glycosylase family protein [Nitriliruptorales bacterium]
MARRTILAPAPIDLASTLGELRLGTHDPTIRLTANEVLRAANTPCGPATLHLRADGRRIEAEAWGEGADHALHAAPDLVGCRDGPESFRPTHPLIRDLQRRRPGVRIGRTGAVVDALVPTVLGQKVTGLEQKRAWQRLVRTLGRPAPGPGGLRVPPTAAELARTPYFRYHPFGVERRRAEAIRGACARASRLEAIAEMDAGDGERRLLAFPGVGPWTAAIVRRLALGDPDAVEVGDYNLPHLVSWNLAGEARGDDDRMLELLEPFAGHRGRALRLLELGGDRPPRYGPRLSPRDIEAI